MARPEAQHPYAQAENAYLLKALSGSLLLTDGTTLISAEVGGFLG